MASYLSLRAVCHPRALRKGAASAEPTSYQADCYDQRMLVCDMHPNAPEHRQARGRDLCPVCRAFVSREGRRV